MGENGKVRGLKQTAAAGKLGSEAGWRDLGPHPGGPCLPNKGQDLILTVGHSSQECPFSRPSCPGEETGHTVHSNPDTNMIWPGVMRLLHAAG